MALDDPCFWAVLRGLQAYSRQHAVSTDPIQIALPCDAQWEVWQHPCYGLHGQAQEAVIALYAPPRRGGYYATAEAALADVARLLAPGEEADVVRRG